MLKQIVALGAGRAIMEQPDNPIHAYLLSLVKKRRPTVLFLPTASGDSESYTQAFYRAYTPEICVPSDLKLFYREELDLRGYILRHDIIHVGGGNTANMLAVWRLHGVDSILREAWEAGKILCGGSAGALCWFEGGITDSFGSSRLVPLMNCLGFLEGSICPHYDVDRLRKPAYHTFMKLGLVPPGYAADNEVALHFVNHTLQAAITSRPGGKAYKVYAAGRGRIIEQPLDVRLLQTPS